MVLVGPAAAHYEMDEEGLRAGTEGGTYTVRARPGEAGESFARLGVSLRRLVAESGADPEAIGYVVVPRPDGTNAYLPGADLAEPPPFEGGLPVLVSADSGCIRFLRPATGPEDANGEDNIASCGASLTIGVRDGNLLTVRASASDPIPEAGETVSFEATAEGAKAGETIEGYRWSFGDGTSAEGAAVAHAFTAAGSYKVTVTASGSEESGGESAPLTIVVGNPATTPAGTGTGAATTQKKKNEAGAGSRGGHRRERGRERGRAELHRGSRSSDPLPHELRGGSVEGPTIGPAGRRPRRRRRKPKSLRSFPRPKLTRRRVSLRRCRSANLKLGRKRRARAKRSLRVGWWKDGWWPTSSTPSAAAPRGAAGAGGASTALAAAPANGARSVPVTAVLAAMLLAAGGAFEWRRQGKGRRQR